MMFVRPSSSRFLERESDSSMPLKIDILKHNKDLKLEQYLPWRQPDADANIIKQVDRSTDTELDR